MKKNYYDIVNTNLLRIPGFRLAILSEKKIGQTMSTKDLFFDNTSSARTVKLYSDIEYPLSLFLIDNDNFCIRFRFETSCITGKYEMFYSLMSKFSNAESYCKEKKIDFSSEEAFFDICMDLCGNIEENAKKMSRTYILLQRYVDVIEHINVSGEQYYIYVFLLSICEDGYNGSMFITTSKEIDNLDILNLSLILSGVISNDVLISRNREAIKSAVSAIMARNMSHNLGSHILTNTKNEIKKIAGELTNDIKNAANFRGLSELLQYLQERQDFIAVIANCDKYSSAPLNLKSGVFDVLAADGLSKRHAGSEPITNYILDNIVRSENVYRKLYKIVNTDKDDIASEEDYQLYLDTLKDKKIENPDLTLQSVKIYDKMAYDVNISNIENIAIEIELIDKRSNRNDSFRSLKKVSDSSIFSDIELAIPYGINGRHSILTIIENIIRNSAKHNILSKRGNLIISIIINDSVIESKDPNTGDLTTKSAYQITICDNMRSLKNAYEKFVEKEIITKSGEFCKLDIIDPQRNGALDKKHKGIKEMLICLLWLSGSQDFWEIENTEKVNELLSIVGVENDDNSTNTNIISVSDFCNENCIDDKYSLGYQFNIAKHTEVCYCDYKILAEAADINKFIRENLDSAYLYVFYNCHSDNNADNIETIAKRILPRVFFTDSEKSACIKSKKTDQDKTNEEFLKKHFDSFIKNKLGRDESYPCLFINDNEDIKHAGEWVCKPKVKEGSKPATEYPRNGNYIEFSTHYETYYLKEGGLEIEKQNSDKGFGENRLFVEGISGGNFTQNLIRTPINNRAYYKIAESALTNILIVDERIFSAYEVSVNKDVEDIEKKVAKFIDNNKSIDYSILGNITIVPKRIEVKIKGLLRELTEDSKEECKAKICSLIKPFINADKLVYTDKYLRGKGIYILNCDEKGYLYNLSNGDISVEPSTQWPKQIDYITIHYSLFEKYKNFKKSNNKGIKQEFNEIFSGKVPGINENTKIAIHSGRGGLIDSLEDGVAFIPLSGLEWALNNCKYVLSDLFTGQKYSQTKLYTKQ